MNIEKIANAIDANVVVNSDAEIERWCSLFASHGTDVRISK